MSLKQNLPLFIIFTTYIAIEVFHLYLVKETTFVLYLVALFILVRITALLLKAKELLAILAVFSCIFIASNYKNLYKINSLNLDNSKALADNINSYSSKYWTDQETFKKLIVKQEELVKSSKELPSLALVISLIVLIELSLVYLVATLKTRDNEPVIFTNSRGGFSNNSNRQNNAINVTNKTKVLQNSSIATKDLQTVTNVTNCNNLKTKGVTKSKIVTNIKAKNPYVTKKVDCNKNVTDNVTSVTPKTNNVTKPVTNVAIKDDKCKSVTNNKEGVTNSKSNIITLVTDKSLPEDKSNNSKQQDIYKLSKQDFIAKYNVKESYYRVIKSRLKNKTKQDKDNKKIERINNNKNNQSFAINNLQQELMYN